MAIVTYEQVKAAKKKLDLKTAWEIRTSDNKDAWSKVQQHASDELIQESLRERWVKARGLTKATGDIFWGRLIARRRTTGYRASSAPLPDRLPGDDHVSLWLKNGKPHVYVSQPYPLTFQTIEEMVAAAQRYGLGFSISAWPAWWNHSHVTFVEWQARALVQPQGT